MGAYVELIIDQGANFNNTLTLTDDVTSNVVNISTYTVRSKMKRSYYSSNSTTIAAEITDSANGVITMSMTPANTANLKIGRYVFDLETIDSQGNVSRVLEGTIFVTPEVTT